MIHFFAPGEPVAKARAGRRIVKSKTGKSFVQSYTPKKTAKYETMIAELAKQQMIMREPTSAPIKLDLVLFFAIPESWPKWKQEAAQTNHIAHTAKPDADNVVKAIKDGLNKIVWVDDSQVCEVHVMKLYSNTPGVLIDVTELTISPSQITKKLQLIEQKQQRLAA